MFLSTLPRGATGIALDAKFFGRFLSTLPNGQRQFMRTNIFILRVKAHSCAQAAIVSP